MSIAKQHGWTAPGSNYPAFANVTVKAMDGTDHEHDDRVVLSVRSAAKADGSCGDLGTIEMTRLEFINFANGGLEALQP